MANLGKKSEYTECDGKLQQLGEACCISFTRVLSLQAKGASMDKWLVLVMAAQVVLTSGVMVLMGRRRFAAARNREFHYNAFRTMDLAGANEGVITASRNFDNLFQMPTLFFIGCLAVLHFGISDFVFVCIAAIYVALRLLHTVVHVTTNHVRQRFNLFLGSCVVLWCLWGRLCWSLFVSA
jgi:hypothetical protein